MCRQFFPRKEQRMPLGHIYVLVRLPHHLILPRSFFHFLILQSIIHHPFFKEAWNLQTHSLIVASSLSVVQWLPSINFCSWRDYHKALGLFSPIGKTSKVYYHTLSSLLVTT
jgi:hypothetical protein